MRKDQRGLTLVELLIVIAILSIVSVSILGFLITSTNSYASASTEVNLQKEAQIVMNQIEDLIIDTSKVVTYSYQADESDAEHFVIKDADIPSDAYAKYLCMYNGDIAYEISWKKDGNEQLYYAEYTVADGVKTNTPQKFLLADYVEAFRADLTNLEANRVVELNIDFKKGDRTYHSSNNVTIRNKVVVNKLDDYEDPTIPTGEVDEISAEKQVYLSPNQSYTFQAPIVTGTGTPSQEVTWEFDSSTPHDSKTTLLSNGTITMSRTEDHDSFNVIARSVANSSKTAIIKVNLVKVRTVVVSDEVENANSSKYKAGVDFALKAVPSGVNLNMDENTGKFTWSIEAGAEYVDSLGTNSSGNEEYAIKSNAPSGSVITFRATSVHSDATHFNYPDDNHIYGELTITVTQPVAPFLMINDHKSLESYISIEKPYNNRQDFFYLKIEYSEAGKNNWINVGNIYQNELGFYYNYDPSMRGWYVGVDRGANYALRMPSLDLDYDYQITLFIRQKERNNWWQYTGRQQDSNILQEVIPRTELVYSCSNPPALCTSAPTVDMHLYTYDYYAGYISKTYWRRDYYFDMNVKQKYKTIAGDGGNPFDNGFKWGGNFPSCFRTQNDGFRIGSGNIKYGTYEFYPIFMYNNKTYQRPENKITLTIDKGNITIDGKEMFLPYPSHPKFKTYALGGVNETFESGDVIANKAVNAEQVQDRQTFHVWTTLQSDGSYKMKIGDTNSTNRRIYGTWWCSADGTEWKKI